MKSLLEELFSKADVPQIKCVIENLANIIVESSGKGHNMQMVIEFLCTYSKMIEMAAQSQSLSPTKNESFSNPLSPTKTATKAQNVVESPKAELYKLFSLLRIYNRLLGKFKD